MKQTALALLLAVVVLTPALSRQSDNSFSGRWDLTVKTPQATFPSWLEVTDNGGNPAVRLVAKTGSVHPATDVKIANGHLTFTGVEWFGHDMPLAWDLTVSGEKLSGTIKRSKGGTGNVSGVRAPALNRPMPAAWSNPEPLFDGKDLQGWKPDNPAKNHWAAENGELVNQAAGANLISTRKFNDFKLHIEYNCPQDGNSGVYLRGRYEVQVEYEPADKNDRFHMMGSIYGFLPPSRTISPRPGQWESYDITLVGRHVTVVRDDVKIIDDQEIPGITGGALNSDEGAAGPLYIQGDHTGGMKYRNITISVPR